MFADRQEGVARACQVLQRGGFFLFDLHNARPSTFDLIGRRDSTLLLIKVLKNVDALGPEEAIQLKLLARLLGGTPLVVGSTSGGTELTQGVLYSRYGLAIVTLGSLEDYVLKGLPPFLFSSPGGVFARLDGRRLRRAREARSLSLGAVADAAGVSRRTIQLYEEGAGAEAQVVARLEEFLGVPLAAPLDPFDQGSVLRSREGEEEFPTPRRRPGGSWSEDVFQELDEQGWEVVVTVRSPFDALARDEAAPQEDFLLMGVGDLKSAEKRSRLLYHIARVAEGHCFFVVPERREKENIGGTPLVSLAELRRHRAPEELRDLISERTL
jgi:putative transcriptional regulator